MAGAGSENPESPPGPMCFDVYGDVKAQLERAGTADRDLVGQVGAKVVARLTKDYQSIVAAAAEGAALPIANFGPVPDGEPRPVGPERAARPGAVQPPAESEFVGEIGTHSLDGVTPLTVDEVGDRIDSAAPDVPRDLRAILANVIATALAQANPHSRRAAHDADGGGHAIEEWDEALQRGLSIGIGDSLLRVSFMPTTAPAHDTLTALAPEDAKTVRGTSVLSTITYSDKLSRQKNIGVGGVLDFFTAAVGHATFLSPGLTFVPRKQLVVASARVSDSVGGSRLMDGPQSTYTTGTTATINVLRRAAASLTYSIDLPEHQVTYAVRTSILPPSGARADAFQAASHVASAWADDVTSPSRLAKYPFALTRLDAGLVLEEIGKALLDAGYTGEEAAWALAEIAEQTFNPELAKRFNQSLLDGSYRSGLVEVAHVLGNVRISLELTSLYREPDITGNDAVPLRADFADALFTEDSRAHGYDAPFEFEMLARVFGLKVGGGGFGLETTTMYEASVEEAHARKFAASFGGDLARYRARLRAVVEFDTDSTRYVKPGQLKHLGNPVVTRKPVAAITVSDIPGEIVLPALHADAFQHDVTTRVPDLSTVSDRLIGLYAKYKARLPVPGPRPDDGVRLADGVRVDHRRPPAALSPRPGVLTEAAGSEQSLYTKGLHATDLPEAAVPEGGWQVGEGLSGLRGPAEALLEQAARGGVQVVVQDPTLTGALRDLVQERWPPDAEQPVDPAVSVALSELAATGGRLSALNTADLLNLFVTDPSVRIIDADGVMITRHSPHIPVARQYLIAPDGQIYRSVRTTLDAGVYDDDVRTAVYSLDPGGATLQLASGKGLGAAATPMAPGQAKLLRHVEQAMAMLMDKRNGIDGLWELKPSLQDLTRYQSARVRTELMNRLSAYFGTARSRSGFDTLLRQGFKVSVIIKSRRFWQRPRRFEILVKADLLDRLDGGVSATEPKVAVDLQAQGDMQSASVVDQENAFMLVGDADLETGFGGVARFNVAELYVEFEVGTVNTRELTTRNSTFSRLSVPAGEASRPAYRVRYKIDIAEFNPKGEKIGQWGHGFHDEVSPVVPKSLQPGHAAATASAGYRLAGSRHALARYLSGLDEFWELRPASYRRLREQRLRFDLTGATGVTLRMTNLEKMTGEAMAMIALHDAKYGIQRHPGELADVETRVRDAFDESYFGAHLPRLTGFNGMQVGLPWLRRMQWQAGGFHGKQLSNVKSSLDIKLVLVPSDDVRALHAPDATMMGRRHHQTDAQQNSGTYVNLFGSAILGPQFGARAGDPDSDTYIAIAPQAEIRGEVEHFREKHTATGADTFTMLEHLRGGVSIGRYSAAVQITLNTRFSKQEPVSTTRTFFLGDGTAQLEMPASLHESLSAPDPLAGRQPVPEDNDSASRRVLISPQLGYATAHVHAFVPGDEVAKAGGVANWIISTLKSQQLLHPRFLSSTDVNTRKLTATFDENALAGDLATLMTHGVAEHLDFPQLGDRRLTVVLKGASTRGPEYVRSSGGSRATTGTRSMNEKGTLTEGVYAGGVGPNIGGSAAMSTGTGATAYPDIAYRRDTGRVIGNETITTTEDLRRVSGPQPDEKQHPVTDDFMDELSLSLEIYTDWVPGEPVRFLTSGAKSITAPLSKLMAAKPADRDLGRERKPLSLNDNDGFRTPVAVVRLPETVKVPMTVDRNLTQAANAYRHPAPGPRADGFQARSGRQAPGRLNLALAPILHGISFGDVVNIDRHVRYAGGHWNMPDSVWQKLAPSRLATHEPAKEGSYSRTGTKGRQSAQALSPGVLRGNTPRVLAHDYPVIPKGRASGITYGMELSGIGRPLPREIPLNENPTTGLTLEAKDTEMSTSFARYTVHQGWIDPLSGGNPAAGQPSFPHVNDVRAIEPAAAVAQHSEIHYRSSDTFVGYEFTGQDILHSRGISLVLNNRGSLTGFLRNSDAIRLAAQFPEQVVHPEAVTFADKQKLTELGESLNGAGPRTVHLLIAPEEAGDAHAFALHAAEAGHTVEIAEIVPGTDPSQPRLSIRAITPAGVLRKERDDAVRAMAQAREEAAAASAAGDPGKQHDAELRSDALAAQAWLAEQRLLDLGVHARHGRHETQGQRQGERGELPLWQHGAIAPDEMGQTLHGQQAAGSSRVRRAAQGRSRSRAAGWGKLRAVLATYLSHQTARSVHSTPGNRIPPASFGPLPPSAVPGDSTPSRQDILGADQRASPEPLHRIRLTLPVTTKEQATALDIARRAVAVFGLPVYLEIGDMPPIQICPP